MATLKDLQSKVPQSILDRLPKKESVLKAFLESGGPTSQVQIQMYGEAWEEAEKYLEEASEFPTWDEILNGRSEEEFFAFLKSNGIATPANMKTMYEMVVNDNPGVDADLLESTTAAVNHWLDQIDAIEPEEEEEVPAPSVQEQKQKETPAPKKKEPSTDDLMKIAAYAFLKPFIEEVMDEKQFSTEFFVTRCDSSEMLKLLGALHASGFTSPFSINDFLDFADGLE